MNRDPQEGPQYRTAGNCADKDCVEVAYHQGSVYVRDSKDQAKAPHVFTRSEWEVFLAGAKAGEFDPPQ